MDRYVRTHEDTFFEQMQVFGADRGRFPWRRDRPRCLGLERIHHAMRIIGQAEHALVKMCRRMLGRQAFGKTLAEQSVW